MARRLRLSFRDAKDFIEEYRRNIAVGGAFVRTAEEFEPRETVCVELELGFCGANLDLDAEVVHRVPPRPDAPEAAGVAVQFQLPADEIRRRLDRHARAAEDGVTSSPQASSGAMKKLGRLKTTPISREEVLPRREGRTPARSAERARSRPAIATGRSAPDTPRSPRPAPTPAAPASPAGRATSAATRASTATRTPAPEVAPDPSIAGEDLEILLAEMSSELGDESGQGEPAAASMEASMEGAGFGELVLEDGDEESPATDPPSQAPSEWELADDDPLSAPEPDADEAVAGSELGEEQIFADAGAVPEEAWTQPDASEHVFGAAGEELGEADADGDDDRRRDRREAARVPVRVDATHVSLDGRTRDLSESGLLVSVDGAQLPIGKAVSIALVHPETGETLEVRGRVARHVPNEGGVAAVGIRFEPEEGEGEQLAERVRELKEAERERRRGGISGALEEIGVVNLLQALARCSPRGTLTVVSGQEEGVVAFEDGFLCYARIGSLHGQKALARLLGWNDGWFEFHARVDVMTGQDAPILLEAAILEAARQFDEASRDENASFDPAAKLRVDMKLLTHEHFDLDKTEQAVIDLAVAGFTIRRILDVIPEADSRVLDALRSLQDRGLVQLAD